MAATKKPTKAMSSSNFQHIMSCTRKGCLQCEPKNDEKTKEAITQEDDSYRIRTGFKRLER